jgi:CO/xanthine dehydrogenase Mo-binding subunit
VIDTRAIDDADGQSLATSFLDYPLPSAREMPRVELFHLTTPSPVNRLGGNRMPLNPARISDLVAGV